MKAFHDLKIFLTAQKGCEIFTDFVKNFEDGIIFDLAQKIGIENPVAECQKRVTAGDSIWLHDKETATGDLEKLIIDWQIVAESHKFGIDGKSFSGCVKNWADYCRFNLKIPADVIGDYYPATKNFFALLKEICERNDIPQSKREFFLCQLVDNAEIIQDALSEPLKILRDKHFYQLDGLNDEEITDVYQSLPYSSFTDSYGRYNKNVSDLAKRMQSSQLKSKLLELWRKVAGNRSPREWSKIHRTPIFAMVPHDEMDNAKRLFVALLMSSPPEKELNFAIDYLEKPPPYLATLNDEQKIEEAFRREIIGEKRAILLRDNDEVRDAIEWKTSNQPYEWYSNSRVNSVIEKLVENKYYTGEAHDKVTARVMQMSGEDAKKLLIALLDKNYEVGLKLLGES